MRFARSMTAAVAATLFVFGLAGVSGGAAHAMGPAASERRVAASEAASPPGAPRHVTAVVGDAQAKISWLAPRSDGGSPVTLYMVLTDPDGNYCYSKKRTSCTLTGLTNGVTYTAIVYASNDIGDPTPSKPVEFTPMPSTGTVPGKVRNLDAEDGSKHKIDVDWREPSDTGGSPITSYRYRYGAVKGTFGKWHSVTRTAATIEDERGGKQAIFIQVQAKNAKGFGATASVTFKP